MCEPVTITLALTAAISAASAAMAANQQREAAQAEAEFQQQQADADAAQAEAEIAAFGQNQNQLNLRGAQEADAAAQRSFEARIKTLRDTSTAASRAAEVQGLSVDELLADFGGAGGRAQNAIQANLDNERFQLQQDRLAAFQPVEQAFANLGSTPTYDARPDAPPQSPYRPVSQAQGPSRRRRSLIVRARRRRPRAHAGGRGSNPPSVA